MVMERNDFPSSRASYRGGVARLELDYTRDVVILGPLEEQLHVENPQGGEAGRARTLQPGRPFALEAAFTGFGDHPDDEPWQFHRYLTEHRLAPYPKAVTFNSNGIDDNRISTGAKDDMDLDTTRQVADIARRLGVETFILDDGWQARSGDWEPDSPAFPEPRYDGSPGSRFAPRFPDERFEAVREAIAPMRLGLWMSPMHFNPSSRDVCAEPVVAVPARRDRAPGAEHRGAGVELERGGDLWSGTRRRCRTSRRASVTASSTGARATGSSTSWPGWTAPGGTTSTRCTTSSWP
jgi:hypothetical protein